MKKSTNQNLAAFGREIQHANDWLKTRLVDQCGFSAKVLLDRLMQRLIELSLYPYSLRARDTEKVPEPGEWLDCDRAYIETGTGNIKFSYKQQLLNQRDFLIHWLYCLFAILAVKTLRPGRNPTTLVFGVGEESLFVAGSDARFVDFCRESAINPLRNSAYFLIESVSVRGILSDSAYHYCNRPLITLVRTANMDVQGRLALLGKHLVLLVKYALAVMTQPHLALLGREMAYTAVASELDRQGHIDAIVITLSTYHYQPLWMRGLKHAEVHMVWYAQNFKPVTLISDQEEAVIPSLPWIRVDRHWVWTHSFASYLKNLGQDNVEVVGPIVWYRPNANTSALLQDQIEIAIFDVSPASDDYVLRNGHLNNYIQTENLIAFVLDIVDLKSRLEDYFRRPVVLHLKTKRGYKPKYSRQYFDLLEELEKSGALRLEHHSSNMFELIAGSHLSIVYPYTSPAYIAEWLGLPSIYYDPTGNIRRHEFGDSGTLINFAAGKSQLVHVARTLIETATTSEGQNRPTELNT